MIINTVLKAQDTPSIYKVHIITAKDLRYESLQELKGVFTSGKEENQKQIHFRDSAKFEKHIYSGIDSLIVIPGTYSYNSGRWLILKQVDSMLKNYALISFDNFMFLIGDSEVKQFESEFKMVAGKFRYSALKAFEPDGKLLEVCQAFSNRYFLQQIKCGYLNGWLVRLITKASLRPTGEQ